MNYIEIKMWINLNRAEELDGTNGDHCDIIEGNLQRSPCEDAIEQRNVISSFHFYE